MTKEQLKACLQISDQTAARAWILGSLPPNFYALSCNYTHDMVAEVSDEDLNEVVKVCVQHMQELEKDSIVFDNGQGFHRHTLEFTDRVVKALINLQAVEADKIYFTVGMVAHQHNVDSYQRICDRLGLTRLTLIFLSESQGLLNQLMMTDSFEIAIPQQDQETKDKLFAALGCEPIQDSVVDFHDLSLVIDRSMWYNFEKSNECASVYGRVQLALVHEDLFNRNTANYGELDSLRFTLKTYNPMAYRQCFILAGRPGSLAMLHDMGFKTFSPLIDETYDTLTNDSARLYALLDEIQRLSQFTKEQWQEFHLGIQDIVEHNFIKLKSMMNTVIFENEVDRFYKSI